MRFLVRLRHLTEIQNMKSQEKGSNADFLVLHSTCYPEHLQQMMPKLPTNYKIQISSKKRVVLLDYRHPFIPGASCTLEISGLLFDRTSFFGVKLHRRIEESSKPPQIRPPSLEIAAELNLWNKKKSIRKNKIQKDILHTFFSWKIIIFEIKLWYIWDSYYYTINTC